MKKMCCAGGLQDHSEIPTYGVHPAQGRAEAGKHREPVGSTGPN